MHQMTNRELFTTFLPEEKTKALFHHFKSLRNMVRAPYEEFAEIGLDKHDVKQVRAVLELSRKYAARTPEIKKINSAKDTYALLAPLMQDLDQEVIRCILLDKRRGVLATPLITMGTLSSCSVDPREIFKEAIRINAHSLIMAHQHPSGDPSPSQPDISTTQRVKDAGKILGIEVIDHVIIGKQGRYFSFFEGGLL
ncbi:MAG: DNA repair protein RadC [Firmicutes bacterium]|nr:DNA repair protein RadC [Bacillota bacterium]